MKMSLSSIGLAIKPNSNKNSRDTAVPDTPVPLLSYPELNTAVCRFSSASRSDRIRDVSVLGIRVSPPMFLTATSNSLYMEANKLVLPTPRGPSMVIRRVVPAIQVLH
ncbi:MAG: hypothetical protein LM523_12915 [Candidatus Contendobacter sp.]|nr:hypothetical protein [Candidatus Contendobacter sp.]